MKIHLFTTIIVAGLPRKGTDNNNISARHYINNIHYKGSPYSEGTGKLLLDPIISITGMYGVASKVTFIYPADTTKGQTINVSEYKIVQHDPLRITFNVNNGSEHGEYTLIEDKEKGTWSGFFSQDGHPIYALSGNLIIVDA